MNELLKVESLEKEYRMGAVRVPVLKGLNLDLHENETVAVMGASGVGKSTLLHVLGAIDRPSKGTIQFKGRDLSKENSKSLANFRNASIGFVFQFHYLLPEFTAIENVAMPLMMRGVNREEANMKAKEKLTEVELSHRFSHRPAELSGGEQQRVAIARALIGKPSLILADEPTGSLDLDTGGRVMELLFKVVREQGASLIVATHNPEVAKRTDRLLRMKDGLLFPESAA
jgi:lipoprotein-releasing system ATP-binding protein